MAQYSNYKKVSGSTLPAQSVTASKLQTTGLDTWNVKWFYGRACECTTGCCCLWTVPTGVARMTIEMWGAGGSGQGACSCNRCQTYRGAQGGYYNSKTIDVQSGWTYTVCAGGVYRCRERDCVGCCGCASYVNGCNLSNFCAIGGHGGIACGNWSIACFSYMPCCLAPPLTMVTLEWVTTWVDTGVQRTSSAIAMVDITFQHLLHLLELMLCRVFSSAGSVVVAGLFLMVTVDRVH